MPRVNYSHPMAKDLACFYVEVAGQTFVDALTGARHGLVAGQTAKVTEEGRVINWQGGTLTQSLRKTVNPRNVSTTRTSIIARLRLSALPGAQTDALTYCAIASGNTNTGVFVGFNSSGFAGGGAFGQNDIGVYGSNNRVGQWVTLGARHGTAAGTGEAFENGKYLGSAAIGNDNLGTADTIKMGREPAGYDALFNGDIAWVAAFNRLLTDREFLWWYNNPFAVLVPQRGWILKRAVVVGGKVPWPLFQRRAA